MYKRIILILGASLLSGETVDAAVVKFESKMEVDRQFIETNQSWISDRYAKLESYFHADTTNSLTVQVMPVSENPDFTSCARIYGTGRIYAHSPSSLKALNPEERKKYNSFCFERNYDDLKYTLVHEYVHVLTLFITKAELPKWVWEGTAVAQSGQLKYTQMGALAKEKLRGLKTINACTHSYSESDAYLIGGAVLNFYESKNPGFIFQLIKFLNQTSSAKFDDFMKKKKINCVIPTPKIIAAI